MAGFAGCGKTGRDVIHRRSRIVVIRLMARHAGGAGQVVIVVDVAIGALPRGDRVCASQNESGAVVVKRRIEPGRRAVAGIASLGEVCRDVVRVRRALIILQVARHAGRARQVVIVVDVAIDALPWRHRVHACQGESGSGMIELAVGPEHRVMALLARRGEASVGYGAGGGVVIVLVATDARRVGDGVIVVDVTIGTLPRRHRVRAGQWES